MTKKSKRSKKTKKRLGRADHLLISSGGQGCIFRPEISCDTRSSLSNKKNKQNKQNKQKRLSKISFHKKSSDREFTMDEVVRLIPKHDQWAILWDEYCESPPYRFLKLHTEIEDCFRKHPQKHTSNTRFPMLVGEYGGISLFEYGEKVLTKRVFSSQKAFDKVMEPLASMIDQLYEGILSLQEHKISHGDLSVRNVILSKNKLKMIDFGMATRKSDLDYLKGRTKFIGSLDRCYDPYPYEYIIQGLSKGSLKKELDNLKAKDYRDGYEDYLRFHQLLGNHDRHKEIIDYLTDIIQGDRKKSSVSKLFLNLDTYSLGLLLPTLLHDVGTSIGINFETILERSKNTPYLEKSCEYSRIFKI